MKLYGEYASSKDNVMKILAHFVIFAIIYIKKGVLYMSQVVNVNFRMDAELKKSMEEVCSDIGINLTTAFTIFAKKVSRERRIPFELSADPFYSENNMKYLEKVISDIDEGRAKLVEHDIIEVDE